MAKKQSPKTDTFTFSADVDFITDLKQKIEEPFSRVVVKGLRLYLEHVGGQTWAQSLRIDQRIGPLTQPLQFVGRWIVSPDSPLRYNPPPQDPASIAGDDEGWGMAEFLSGGKTTWWVVALTIESSFIWFWTEHEDGFRTGQFQYNVQDKSNLHYMGTDAVPSKVYDQVREIAGPLPTKVIQ